MNVYRCDVSIALSRPRFYLIWVLCPASFVVWWMYTYKCDVSNALGGPRPYASMCSVPTFASHSIFMQAAIGVAFANVTTSVTKILYEYSTTAFESHYIHTSCNWSGLFSNVTMNVAMQEFTWECQSQSWIPWFITNFNHCTGWHCSYVKIQVPDSDSMYTIGLGFIRFH